MNLTVGPLPPAVYWRRRALVAGGLLLLILLVVYSCGGSSGSGAPGRHASTATPATGSPRPTTSQPHPQTAASPSTDPSAATDPGDPAGQPPVTTATPPAAADATTEMCADADILLTPSVQQITGGTYRYELTLKIKNTSTRACKRDVGSNPQELHVVQNGQTVWSSDSCQGASGQNNVVTFGPGIEDTFKIGWDGTAGQKCSGGTPLPTGTYQIVAKLDTKASAPVTFTITGK
jgi:hypothetical protein